LLVGVTVVGEPDKVQVVPAPVNKSPRGRVGVTNALVSEGVLRNCCVNGVRGFLYSTSEVADVTNRPAFKKRVYVAVAAVDVTVNVSPSEDPIDCVPLLATNLIFDEVDVQKATSEPETEKFEPPEKTNENGSYL